MKRITILTALLTLLPIIAFSKPNSLQNADFSAFAHSNSGYTFYQQHYLSADQKRKYVVYIGIPQQAAPVQGFPVLYALDGNAVATLLSQSTTWHNRAVILVLIGNDTPLRLDRLARSYDYTPNALDQTPLSDPINKQYDNGGAAEFLSLLNQHIRPKITPFAAQNAQCQMLWGHSYGGLFVLYAALHQPQSFFTHYIAGDPSLWLHDGLILQHAQSVFAFRLPENALHHAPKLWLHKSKQQNPIAVKRSTLPANAAEQLVQDMQKYGIQAHYQYFPNETHGSIMAISLQAALDIANSSGCLSEHDIAD